MLDDDLLEVVLGYVAAGECLDSASRIMKILGDGSCVSTQSGHLQLTVCTKREWKKQRESRWLVGYKKNEFELYRSNIHKKQKFKQH